MQKNKILSVAVIICKIVKVFYALLFAVFTLFFIHFQVSPNSYERATFNYKNSSFEMNKSTSWKNFDKNGFELKDEDVFSLDKISKTSLYIIYFQFSAVLLFIFLSVKEFQKVIESIRNLETFQNNNVKSFRKIGKYIFFIFILTSFIFLNFDQGGKSQIHISFTPLLLVLLAFILAEIFKEGNLLKQENDLTI